MTLRKPLFQDDMHDHNTRRKAALAACSERISRTKEQVKSRMTSRIVFPQDSLTKSISAVLMPLIAVIVVFPPFPIELSFIGVQKGHNAVVLCVIASAGIGIAMLAHRALRCFLNVPSVALLALAAFCYASIEWSPNQAYGFDKIKGFAFYGVAPFFIGIAVALTTQQIRTFALWLFLSAVFGIGYVVSKEGYSYKMLGEFGNEVSNQIWVARLVGLGALSATAWVLASRRRISQLFFLAIALALVLQMVLCGSRGAIISLIAGAASMLWMKHRTVPRMACILLLPAVVTVALVLALQQRNPYAGNWERFSWAKLAEDIETKSGRQVLWEAAISDFIDKPLTGQGFGSYSAESQFSTLQSREYPHNVLLEIAAEGGIVGLGLLLLAVAWPFFLLPHAECWDNERSLCFAIWTFGFANALSSGDFISNQILWFGTGLLATRYSAHTLANRMAKRRQSRQSEAKVGGQRVVRGEALTS